MFGPAPHVPPNVTRELRDNPDFSRFYLYASKYVERNRGWSVWRDATPGMPPWSIPSAEQSWMQEMVYQAAVYNALKAEGIQYDAIAGLSLGEAAAGYATAILDAREFLDAASEIVSTVLQATGGDLINIAMPRKKVESALGDVALDLILDWPTSTVWALPDSKAAAVHKRLRKSGIAYARLGYNCMSHTNAVNTDTLHAGVGKLPARMFNYPYYSSWHGGRITSAVEGSYWVHMISEPASLTKLWDSLLADELTDVIYIGSVSIDKSLFASLPRSKRPTRFVRAESLLAPRRTAAARDKTDLSIADGFRCPEFADDPYRFYRKWRGSGSVHYLPEENAWMVLGYDDVSAMLRRPQTFSSHPYRKLSPNLFGADPPDHTRVRRMLARYMTPEKLLSRNDVIRAGAASMIAGLKARDRFDASNELATALAVAVACGWLGVTLEGGSRLSQMPGEGITWEAVEPAMSAERGALHDIRESGEFTDAEAADLAAFLMLASVATVRDLLVFVMFTLMRNRELAGVLSAEPASIPAFVEEVLRLEPPIHGILRHTTEDFAADEKTIPQGSHVWLMVGAANRDPAKYERADELVIGRSGARHLSFGAGNHYCMGTHLGRAETEILIAELLPEIPGMVEVAPPHFDFVGLYEGVPGIRAMKTWTLAFGKK